MSHTLLMVFQTLALTQAPADPCAATAGHEGYTLLLEEGGRFVHCRGGETTEEDPISHERVVLQLPPEGLDQPYRYRLFDPAHPESGHHNPLLRHSLEILEAFQESLHDLSNSPETLGETLQHLQPAGESAPATAQQEKEKEQASRGQPPLSATGGRESPEVLAAEAAQAKYMTYATPAFSDAVHVLRRTFSKLERANARVDHICASSAAKVRDGDLRGKVTQLCAGNPGARLDTDLAPFQAALESFVEARAAARDAVLDFDLTPSSAAEQDSAARKAAHDLAAATALAKRLVADARGAAAKVESFTRDVQLLRAAVAIPPAPEGERLNLGRFSANGLFGAPDIYQVHVLRRPSRFLEAEDIEEGGKAAVEKAEDREILVDRFQPASRNYIDIGIALTYSAGLPDHPVLAGQLGKQRLSQSQTGGFDGGLLFALEPLEFTTLPDPWAKILHFPTLIIPFTLDPLRNYFIGAGVSAFDWVSIDAGLHLALTRVPSPGNYYGESFSTSPIDINHVSTYGPIAGGWFVSLSIDVFGIVHSIVDQLTPTVRDVHSLASLAPAPAPAPAGATQ